MISAVVLTIASVTLSYGVWQLGFAVDRLHRRLFDLERRFARLPASRRDRGDR